MTRSFAVYAAQDDTSVFAAQDDTNMSNCAHIDPPDVFKLAEEWLREQDMPEERWPGMRFRHAENTPGGRWESVIIDIERRGEEWWVTNIDRRDAAVPESAVGLSTIAS